jgi:hypothetical protein
VITHSINKYVKEQPPQKSPDNSVRFHGSYGTEEHKRFIHSRVLLNNKFQPGDHCTINGDLGVVVHVAEEYEDAEWRGLECLLLEVFLYSESDTNMFHPNRLKEYKA